MPLVSPHLRLEYDYDGRITVLEVAVHLLENFGGHMSLMRRTYQSRIYRIDFRRKSEPTMSHENPVQQIATIPGRVPFPAFPQN